MSEFNSILQLFQRFPDEQAARDHFAQVRWAGKPVCPHCDGEKCYAIENGKRFKCGGCKKKFSVTMGTIFEASKISLHLWFIAMYMLSAHKKGISSCQLARDLNVTQKTAYFMLQRLREVVKTGNMMLGGAVEADETMVGGKEKNKHMDKKTKGTQGRSTKTKTMVIGFKQRGGNVKTFVVPDGKDATIHDAVTQTVRKGSILLTDEFKAYKKLDAFYDHRTINHSQGQYVSPDGDVHCNGMENYWSLAKRSILGIYHHVSPKHMDRYFDEFDFRYNTRDISEAARWDEMLEATPGKRLTYKAMKAESA